uniref:Cyclohexadienyl dehydrogenase n=1 Tax=uncultured bacterium CSL1 TaxID=1091565 RepID=G4WVA2_9BACT|nr:cyclohexadienyl dehydrogenase [uncultured bacterium CSL1]
METGPAFIRVAIIGFGLIGASLARALRERQMAGHIYACDTNAGYLEYGIQHFIVDETSFDAAIAVAGADLVLIATPPASFAAIAQSIVPALKHGALVMDMGSVKQSAMEAIASQLPKHVDYIPCHPIAGREHSGPEASLATLFDQRRVIITPAEDVREHALHAAMLFWQALGSKPEAMPADLHDAIYATVSHLPQLVAFAATPIIAPSLPESAGFPLFQRFTRLCHSATPLWAEIFALNARPLLVVLTTYLQGVYQIVSELREGEPEAGGKSAAVSAEELAFCRIVLFPRIAASCLVGAVMTTEKKMNLPLARYAGSGFADVACPALEAPDDDLKQISNYAVQIAELLEQFIATLNRLHHALEMGDIAAIEAQLQSLQEPAKRL